MKQLERLLFAQGGECFFCRQQLPKERASIEHLNALANGGANSEDNCVVCCKQLNSLLGSKSIKAKLLVVLNQRGAFACPGGADGPTDDSPEPIAPIQVHAPTANARVAKPKAKQLRFVFTIADTLPPKKADESKSTASAAKASMSPQGNAPATQKAAVAIRPKTPATASSTDERFNLVVANLKQRGASRPRTLKTLTSTVSALFPNGLAKAELASLVQRLQSTGKVTLSENKVLYSL